MSQIVDANSGIPDDITQRIANLSPAKRALLELKLKEARKKDVDLGSIPKLKESGNLPLSFAQQRLWFLDQLEPGSVNYNIPAAWRLKGTFDKHAIHKALNTIIERHGSLRTSFTQSNGVAVQNVDQNITVDIPLTDLSELESEKWTKAIQLSCAKEANQPFDLTKAPLIRCGLLRLSVKEHILLITMHHIITDGWSMDVFYRELWELYETFSQNRPALLAELPIQYTDFAVWQRQRFEGNSQQIKQLEYWKDRLEGAPPVLELPMDRPYPAVRSFRGARHEVVLPPQLLEDLKRLSREESCTLFMTLLAAFQLLLHRYTGQEDVVVGSPIAARNRAEIENLIGFFVNTLVLRTDFSGQPTFKELLKRVRETAFGAFENQEFPFDRLVEELRPDRQLSHNPLIQVMFALQNTPKTVFQLSGLTISSEHVDNRSSKFDLTLFATETTEGLRLSMVYATDLFEQKTIERMLSHYCVLLESIVDGSNRFIGEIPILTPLEKQQLLETWNETKRYYANDVCVHELFEAQVEKTPDNVALVFEEQQLSYAELNSKANQVAYYLRELGIGPDTLVGIFLERSLEMVIGMLAVLKAGGGYVPLDPTYPAERLSFMMQDAQVNIILTQKKISNQIKCEQGLVICLDDFQEDILRQSRTNLECNSTPENLAYVIYTSGSTGLPKGVMIQHKALVNLLGWNQDVFPITESDRMGQKTPYGFDASILEFSPPLLVGATLVLAKPFGHQDVEYLVDWILTQKITILRAVPTLLRMLLLEPKFKLCNSLRLIFSGGEALPVELRNQFFDTSKADLVNAYGPTEACVDATCYRCSIEDLTDSVPIGRPISNTQVYILDDNLQQVPVGVVGELHIGGAGLAKGYLNRPALTAEKFIPNPFGRHPDDRLYKAGDLARYRPDGNIEFLGRKDHQVKLRGFRIELGEIESVLGGHAAIETAVVVVREDVPGDKRLTAYLVENSEELDLAVIRGFVKEKLPDYMLPASYVVLERMPTLPNGKVDRKSLPAPSKDAQGIKGESDPPRTAVEKVLAEIWAGVLQLEKIGIYDNFFEAGGHSLLAVKMMSRVRTILEMELPLRTLFEAPTIAELGDRIDRIITKIETRQPGDSKTMGRTVLPPIPQRSNPDRSVLSFAQQRLWFLEQYEPNKYYYNIPSVRRLKGKLDVDALHRALNAIIDRHESLRTTFIKVDGEAVQVIARELVIDLPMTDLQGQDPKDQERTLKRLIREKAKRPFDLSKGPLIRCFLIRLGMKEFVLHLTMHHIISDGWSMDLFYRELWSLYEDISNEENSALPPLSVQYADFAEWQRQWLQGEVLDGQLDYWKAKLSGAPSVLALATDKPRPPVQGFSGAQHTAVLPRSVLADLKILSSESGSTLFMTLLAVYQLLLHRYSGQKDILVGSPVAGRQSAEIENLIGFFVNTLVLRTDFSTNLTIRELLDQVREVVLGAFEHQDVPFEKLVEELKPERLPSHPPLVQVMIALQNMPQSFQQVPGLEILPERFEGDVAKFDLTLFAAETTGGLDLSLVYNTDLFEKSTIERMMGHFTVLLQGILSDPEQRIYELPLLTDPEQQQLLQTWNKTKTGYPRDFCVHQLFENQVEKTPDATAIEFGTDRLTYKELENRTNQLANYLHDKGVGPDVLVGICMERSLDMIVGMLGILKAGGAYVPLDPSYPKERLDFMLSETGTPILLTQQQFRDSASYQNSEICCLDADWDTISKYNTDRLQCDVGPNSPAYVIYTSGSTGRPKGVCVPHRGISRLVMNTNYICLAPSDRIANASNSSFDAATFEIWGALLNGACLVGLLKQDLLSPKKLTEQLLKKRISVLFLTTALFNQIVAEEPSAFRSLDSLLFGGEAVDPKWVRTLLRNSPPKRLLHVYGPTENTTFTTWHEVKHLEDEASTVPIGKPISNTAVYILDRHMKPTPVGIPGELYIGGDGLAKGYYNRPELTSRKFVSNPFSVEKDEKLYKTGDLARYLPNGDVEFIGRIDNQIKLRGFRIELGEIEAILNQHAAINDVAVVLREDQPGKKRIVAYTVFKPEKAIGISEIRAFVQEKVPDYMVPSAFVQMDMLPLTQNGKINRKALPVPGIAQIKSEESYLAPRDYLEIQIAKIWEKALGISPVGIRDNFFDLGGHSLLAVQILFHIKKIVGKEIPVAELFKSPTVEQLADIVRLKGWSSPFSLLIPFQPLGSKPPFFCIHGAAAEAANHIGLDQPFYGGFPHGFDGKRISKSTREMAEDYIKEIRVIQPTGPYFIGGYSFGGVLAFEIAHQLKDQGQEIALLVLIDATSNSSPAKNSKEKMSFVPKSISIDSTQSFLKRIGSRLISLSTKDKMIYIINGFWHKLFRRTGIEKKTKEVFCICCLVAGIPVPQGLRKFYRGIVFKKAARDYTPPKFDGNVVLLRAEKGNSGLQNYWEKKVISKLVIHEVPGGHLDLFEPPQVEVLAKKLKICLEETQDRLSNG